MKRIKLSPQVAGFVLAGVLASSCGMDDMTTGIDGTGALIYEDIVSSGRVRAQGTLEVNGVRFDTTGSTVRIDNVNGTASQL